MARLPNHKERREYNKKHHTHYTLEDFATIMAVQGVQKGEDISYLRKYIPTDMMHKDNWDLFPDGTKVKLNYEAIMSRPQENLSDAFKQWVEENKDKELTLSREQKQAGLVNVKENLMWLFDLYYDLLCWNDKMERFESPQLIEDVEIKRSNIIENYKLIQNLLIEPTPEDEESLKVFESRINNVTDLSALDQIDIELDQFVDEHVKIHDEIAETEAALETVVDEDSTELPIDTEESLNE